ILSCSESGFESWILLAKLLLSVRQFLLHRTNLSQHAASFKGIRVDALREIKLLLKRVLSCRRARIHHYLQRLVLSLAICRQSHLVHSRHSFRAAWIAVFGLLIGAWAAGTLP